MPEVPTLTGHEARLSAALAWLVVRSQQHDPCDSGPITSKDGRVLASCVTCIALTTLSNLVCDALDEAAKSEGDAERHLREADDKLCEIEALCHKAIETAPEAYPALLHPAKVLAIIRGDS